MKQFLKDIQTKLQDFWQAYRKWVPFIIIGGVLIFGYTLGVVRIGNIIFSVVAIVFAKAFRLM